MQMSAGDLIALPKARHLPDHAVGPNYPKLDQVDSARKEL